MEKQSSKHRVYIMAANYQQASRFMQEHRIRTIGAYLSEQEQLRGLNRKDVDIYRLRGWERHPNSPELMEEIKIRNLVARDWY